MNYDIERIIAAAGGIESLAQAIGLHPRKGYNTISQWRHRKAIPPRTILTHQRMFDKLMSRSADDKE